MRPEESLPPDILAKAVKSGSEFGWHLKDIPSVIAAAQKIHLATIGGQVQYIFSDATYEVYWVCIDTESRKPDEHFTTYVNRTASEFLHLFKQEVLDIDVLAEGARGYEYLHKKQQSGSLLDDFCYFIMYFANE